MARITRKSYKRKKVVFGLCMFAAVALISTGFAAWVISLDSTKDLDGKAQAGEVVFNKQQFGLVTLEPEFRFDVDRNDLQTNEDPMGYNPDIGNPDDYERLTATVSGYVKNAEYLKSISISMPRADMADAFKTAETKEYIKLPDCANNAFVIKTDRATGTKIDEAAGYSYKFYEVTSEDISLEEGRYYGLTEGTAVCEFTYNISFEWGSYFNGKNPGYYYDEHEDKPSDASALEEYYDKVTAFVNSEIFDTLNGAAYKIRLTAGTNEVQ